MPYNKRLKPNVGVIFVSIAESIPAVAAKADPIPNAIKITLLDDIP
jgi:hypothetical protein